MTEFMNGLKKALGDCQHPACADQKHAEQKHAEQSHAEQSHAELTSDDLHVALRELGDMSWFRIQEFGNTVVINILPSFSLESSDIARVVEQIARRRPQARVVVNLSLVQYIGSTFLDRLIIAKRCLSNDNGSLILCGFNSVIEEVFRITKLDGFFEIADEDDVLPKQV